jgi:diguanylate cyclase (GGDEF)-like protein
MSFDPLSPSQPSGVVGRQPLRQKRTLQLAGATGLAIAAAAFSDWTNQASTGNLLVFAAGLVMMLTVMVFARRDHLDLAATLLLVSLTVMLSVLMWFNAGIRDPAVLAYPAILVYASLLGGARLFPGLLAFMLLVVFANVLANVMGWHVNAAYPVNLSTLLDVMLVLGLSGFTVWLMASDLRRTVARLEDEKARTQHMATHDPLTRLPNRLLARDRFVGLAAKAQRQHGFAAVLTFDLDDFKAVNDSLGHAAGDELLREISVRIPKSLRAGDTVSRQGGDEFVLILDDLADAEAAAGIAMKVLAEISAPVFVAGHEVHTTGSLGVAMYPTDGTDFDDLLKKADIAMYRAKDEGRNAFRFFDAAMNDSAVEHVQLVAGMRLALQRGEFLLQYQPQFSLRSGRVVGAEALIRWRHPELGLVAPGRFIPAAEQSGLIVDIGAWVIDEACRQARAWLEAGLPPLVISVNVSPLQFRRGDLEGVVQRALSAARLSPASLELELTESLLIQDRNTYSDLLRRLKRLGVRLAIDDFGTGYSNLGYLKRFEVDRLKIDQSFVRRVVESPQDEAIVRAIIQIAHSLKLGTTAEGIEDAATLAKLRELGCADGQGFVWSPAVPAEQFAELHRRNDNSALK